MAPSIQLPDPQINGTEYRAGPIFWLIDFSLWEKEKCRQGKNKTKTKMFLINFLGNFMAHLLLQHTRDSLLCTIETDYRISHGYFFFLSLSGMDHNVWELEEEGNEAAAAPHRSGMTQGTRVRSVKEDLPSWESRRELLVTETEKKRRRSDSSPSSYFSVVLRWKRIVKAVIEPNCNWLFFISHPGTLNGNCCQRLTIKTH